MKAITLRQPWATLVAIGAKRIETRSWRTSYRGPLAIHAGAGWNKGERELCEIEPFYSALYPAGDMQPRMIEFDRHTLPLGRVIAVCRLLDCLPTVLGRERFGGLRLPPDGPELSFGNYGPGRYAWILEDTVRISPPVECKGALGLWEWPS